jgi:hypothetical protein
MGLLIVAAIGIKSGFVPAIAYLKEQYACRPGKPAQIEDIRQVGYQERVKPASTQQSGKFFLSRNVVHQAFFWVECEYFMLILMESFGSRIESGAAAGRKSGGTCLKSFEQKKARG